MFNRMAAHAANQIIYNLREAAAILKDAGFDEEAEEINTMIRFFKRGIVDERRPLEFDADLEDPSTAVVSYLSEAFEIASRMGFDEQANKIDELCDYFEVLD